MVYCAATSAAQKGLNRVANASQANGNGKSIALLSVLIAVAVLYFARTIFIPLAFSILLAFMLAPLAVRLRHWGVGRIPAVAIVVLVAFGILGVIGALMASQLGDLTRKLPEYQHNVHQKIESIRTSGGGLVKRVSTAVQRFADDLTPPPAATPGTQPPEERPVPVEIRRTPFSPVEAVQKILGSVVGVLVTAGIVVVFVIFMLIEQDDLRDRLMRLAGSRRVNLTTTVLDDAGHRVSRYLLAQFVVNASYGTLTGTVLYFIHVPNPLLWGMLAALFRYIPYLGIWVAATMPAAVALAVRPGWVDVPIVFGVYFGVDLLMYNFVEPVLYGSSTGLSPLAVLVAAVFWTWLWGPAGLLLATPLTVCVVVIGRYVPNLEFLQVLLSDEPVLAPETRFYQRMLALDSEEAGLVVEEFIKGKSLEQAYDAVIVPALNLAEEDRHRGRLDEAREHFLFQNTRIVIEDMAERAQELVAGETSSRAGLFAKPNEPAKITLDSAVPVQVFCLAARDEADELAAFMLQLLLQKRGIGAKLLPPGTSIPGVLEQIERDKPRVACVAAVPPFAYMHTRYLCRRLKSQAHPLKVVAAFLTEAMPPGATQARGASAADQSASSLAQAVEQAADLLKAEPAGSPAPAVAS